MIKILLFLFIVFYPISSFATIDERKTDVRFANGIWNSELNASADQKEVQKQSKLSSTTWRSSMPRRNSGKVRLVIQCTAGEGLKSSLFLISLLFARLVDTQVEGKWAFINKYK